MHRKFAGLLLVAAATFVAFTPAKGDPPPPIPSPPPITVIALNPPRVQPRWLATVTLSDASVVVTRAAAGKFQMVAARPGELITIIVPFPPLAIGTTAAVSALDGGKLIGTSPVRLPMAPRRSTFRSDLSQDCIACWFWVWDRPRLSNSGCRTHNSRPRALGSLMPRIGKPNEHTFVQGSVLPFAFGRGGPERP